jgi:NADH:ubiquinone oxidoreductase subunit 6 (subunit J)
MVQVGPVGILVRVAARARWRSLLALTLVTALAGAVAIASVAGSVRGRGALDEFVEFSRQGTMSAFVDPSLPTVEQAETVQRMVDAAPGEPVVAYGAVVVAFAGPEGPQGPGTDFVVSQTLISGPGLTEVLRPIVLDGELPLDRGEAVINPFVAERRGVEVGDTLEVTIFAAADLEDLGSGRVPDEFETVPVTVGAIARQPLDLPQSPQAQAGTVFEADEGRIVLGPDFWEEHGIDAAAYGVGAIGHVPVERRDEVAAAMREAGGDRTLVQTATPDDLSRLTSVDAAIDLESNALLALAGVVVLFAVVVLGTALLRVTDHGDARSTLVALGLTPRQVASAQLLLGSLAAGVVAVLAVAGAVAGSAVFPVGLARDAEIHPGVEVDLPVLAAGGLLVFLVLGARLALGAWSSRRPARTAPRGRATRVPLTGPGALGARLATDGLGRGGAPVRVALVTAVAGVVAVAAAGTYAASLDRLVGDPELQGWTWDVAVGNYSDPGAVEEGRAALAGNDDVATSLGYNWVNLEVGEQMITLLEVDDGTLDVLPPVLAGRAPQGDDEVALGRGTLEQLGLEIGDTVELRGSERVRAEVVGEVIAPAVLAPPMDLDSGGVATFALTSRLNGEPSYPVSFLVDVRDGVDLDSARERLEEDFPRTVVGPMRPLDVTDLDRVRGFPFLLAALLGAMALVSVVVTLATSTRRRRHEVAVFRSLGIDRGQVRRVLAGEATTFVLAALLLGVPVGVVVGRQAWGLAADGLGTEVGPAIPVAAIVLAAAAVLLAVNVYGQWLAEVVSRRRPGRDLRTE